MSDRWTDTIRRCQAALTDLVLPVSCPRCRAPQPGHSASGLCGPCQESLMAPATQLCPGCGSHVNSYMIFHGQCARCRYAKLYFDRVVTLGPYEDELRSTIVRMKQATEQSLTFAMGCALAQRAITVCGTDMPNLICPVPMHWLRRIVRQASSPEILAQALSRQLGIPTNSRLLACRRRTAKQSMLSPEQRRGNVAGAFRIRRPTVFQGRHVGVVDDIITTGATIQELAGMLKKCGAVKVTAIVAARSNRSPMKIVKIPELVNPPPNLPK